MTWQSVTRILGVALALAAGFAAGFCVRGLDQGDSAQCIIVRRQLAEVRYTAPGEQYTQDGRDFSNFLIDKYNDECQRDFWLF